MVFKECLVTNTGWGKSRFKVVHMKNNTIINNTRINCVSHTHNYKPTFVPPCVEMAELNGPFCG